MRRGRTSWDDRLYLSGDPSLDKTDLQVASFTHVGTLAVGASYERHGDVPHPGDADGRFYVIAFTDSNVFGSLPSGAATIGVAQIAIDHDNVPEFRDEGNNTVVVPIDVTLAPAADLQVTSVIVPEHVLRGQILPVTFTVTNARQRADAGGQRHLERSHLPLGGPAARHGRRPLPRRGRPHRRRRGERRQLHRRARSSGCRAT